MPVDLPPPYEVAPVIVQAAGLPSAPGDAAFSITTITTSDLRQTVRLDDALKQVPGVSLFRRNSTTGANPTTQGIALRSIGGSGAGRALVTLDGAPQNDPFGGWVIWSALPPEALSGVQVVKGGGAGPYGAGALTGTIALSELYRPGAVVADASISTRGGRRASAATDLDLGGPDLLLSASAERGPRWIPVDEDQRGAADDDLALNAWSAAARLHGKIGRSDVALRIAGFEEDRDSGLVGAYSSARRRPRCSPGRCGGPRPARGSRAGPPAGPRRR